MKLVGDRPTDRQTDRHTDRQTDIVTYRVAIAAKNRLIRCSFKESSGITTYLPALLNVLSQLMDSILKLGVSQLVEAALQTDLNVSYN